MFGLNCLLSTKYDVPNSHVENTYYPNHIHVSSLYINTYLLGALKT